ncbi:MAG: phosphoribosylanthranilate isomerase [Anaerolineaceae bacterium]|nr:phosphoribosylanthranilate isomerase [Anaerolineaceae bacterium]
MIIQIGYFTGIEQAIRAAVQGVDYIGFVAGRYGLVYGELSFAEARDLARSLPSGKVSVAMSLSNNLDEIIHMLAIVQPDILQIASNVDQVNEKMMADIRQNSTRDVRLMKTIPVMDRGSIALARKYAQVSDLILLESKVRGFAGIGGTGQVHDWSLSRQIVEAVDVPVMLAGGLTSENVAVGIRAVQPWGVVSNTGTNQSDSQTVKNMTKIKAFVEAAFSASTHHLEEKAS